MELLRNFSRNMKCPLICCLPIWKLQLHNYRTKRETVKRKTASTLLYPFGPLNTRKICSLGPRHAKACNLRLSL